MIKLLVVGSLFPHSAHSVRAANVVVFEMLRALASKGRGHVGYLIVRRKLDPPPTETELAGLHELSCLGVDVLEPIQLPQGEKARSAWLKLIDSQRTDFYPDSIHSNLVYQKIRQFSPHMLFVPWSEWLTALCAEFPIKKFAYYGNPDHKAGIWRMAFDRRHGISRASRLRLKLALSLLEREHIKVMSKYDLIGDVAENDAKYYINKGLKNVFYIQAMWIDRFGASWQEKRQCAFDKSRPIKIIANVGQLGATANRYGLEILGRDVAPRLKDCMGDLPYELHILGMGELIPSLKAILARPEIIIRGFVEDIDQEIFESKVFLCLNNAGPFKVGHTRYLHAWSLGACVIAHQDAALSMPEMKHNQNCLLGRDIKEITEMIYLAISDNELCWRLGWSGYETFSKYFLANNVSDRIWHEIEHSMFPHISQN
jgi:hypothetical protein